MANEQAGGPSAEDGPNAPVPAPVRPEGKANSTAAQKLEKFILSVQEKIPTPLAPKPPQQCCMTKTTTGSQDEGGMSLPLRSKRLANQSLARVPASKRGEVHLMQRMGEMAMLPTPNKKQFEEDYRSGLQPKYSQAVKELSQVR